MFEMVFFFSKSLNKQFYKCIVSRNLILMLINPFPLEEYFNYE